MRIFENRGAGRLRPQHRGHARHQGPARGAADAMNPKILIVEAAFYPHIAKSLLEGATAALERAGAHFERIAVPGALEIPSAILFAVQAARRRIKAFDGFV